MADFHGRRVKSETEGSSKSKKNSSSFSTSWDIPKRNYGQNSGGRCQSSAPVDIPDWSKISKKKLKKNLWDDACNDENDHNYHVSVVDDDDVMIPPHEFLARRLASTQIASRSMCEGVGRTLKGRDLSEVRNAVLTKTGFIE